MGAAWGGELSSAHSRHLDDNDTQFTVNADRIVREAPMSYSCQQLLKISFCRLRNLNISC